MAYAAAHNGGRLQMNSPAVNLGGDFPFLNLLKSATSWSRNGASTFPVAPDEIDDDGYPNATSASRGGVYTICYAPTQAQRSGNYKLKWDGNGTLSLGMNNTLVSGSLTSASGSGSYVFSTTDHRFLIRIVAAGSPKITNLRVFHVDDEDLLENQSEVFGVKFKQRLAEGKFGVYRFLGWQNGNITKVTTWDSRKPISHFSWIAHQMRNAWYAGVTTNSSNDYVTASFPSVHSSDGTSWTSGAPKDKDTIHVVFNATANGVSTLDVGTTGSPIGIRDAYSNALGSSTYPVGGSTNAIATLIYDAQLNVWIKHGACPADGACGLENALPFEIMFRLCAETGMHPYFVAPPMSQIPATDFSYQFGRYCDANQPSWMCPRFEGPNELWNNSLNFYGTAYYNNLSNSYGWGNNGVQYHETYGKSMSTMGQDFARAYGVSKAQVKTQSRYQVIIGVPTTWPVNGNGTNVCIPRVASTKYVLSTPQSGYAADPASDWATTGCCAQYINPSAQTDGTLAATAASFSGKIFDASASSGALSVSGIRANASAPIKVGDTIFDTPIFVKDALPSAAVKVSALTASTTPQNITAISKANPAIVTFTSPLADRTHFYLAGAAANGMTQMADGWYRADSPSGNTSQLKSIASGGNIDATSYSTYSGSGATAQSVGDFVLDTSVSFSTRGCSAATAPDLAETFAATLNSGSSVNRLASIITCYSTWKTWFKSFGIKKMCGYEGGYSPDTINQGNSLPDFLKVASKNTLSAFKAIFDNFNAFIALTDSDFVAEFPAFLTFSGNNINVLGYDNNVWDVWPTIYQSPPAQQWEAMRLFNNRKRRLTW